MLKEPALILSVLPFSCKCHIELDVFREGVDGCLENYALCNHDRHWFSYSRTCLWHVDSRVKAEGGYFFIRNIQSVF